jgi:hypothetical protein
VLENHVPISVEFDSDLSFVPTRHRIHGLFGADNPTIQEAKYSICLLALEALVYVGPPPPTTLELNAVVRRTQHWFVIPTSEESF